MSENSCKHEFIRQRNGGICPVCLPATNLINSDAGTFLNAVKFETDKRLAEKCRHRFATYFRESWEVLEPSTPFSDSWHIDVVCDHLQAAFVGWLRRKRGNATADLDLQNILINVPPGTSKSRVISVAFLSWAWIHDPTFTMIAVSGNPQVALRDADLCKSLVESLWYRDLFKPKWEIRKDRDAKDSFQLHLNGRPLGWRRSVGIKAEIIGERADCLLIDDPHDPRTVFSKTVREDVIYRYDRSFANRLNHLGKSIRLIVMQRVHLNDLSGHVLSAKDQNWAHLKIPLEYSPERFVQTPLNWIDPRQEKGDLLQPDRFPPDFVGTERSRLLSLFECFYNQDPANADGDIFKREWFRFFRFSSDPAGAKRPFGCTEDEALVLDTIGGRAGTKFFDKVTIQVDATFKKTERGSEVGLLVLGQREGNYFLIDDITQPAGYRGTKDLIVRLIERWPEVDEVCIEDKANGPAIIEELRGALPGITVTAVPVDGSKEARAESVSPIVEARQVYLREGLPSLSEFVDQLVTFPLGKRNDRVDAFAQGIREFRRHNYVDRYARLTVL